MVTYSMVWEERGHGTAHIYMVLYNPLLLVIPPSICRGAFAPSTMFIYYIDQ